MSPAGPSTDSAAPDNIFSSARPGFPAFLRPLNPPRCISQNQRDMESLGVVVVGAGWTGLAALKTYLQVHPASSVCLLESASSIGGVWAEHRLWDGLKSNNMRGTYEFSDFPMDDSFGVKHGEHIPGHVIHRYLERYTEHFNLTRFIRLNARVQVVEHRPDKTWTITYVDTTSESTKETTINSRKLILATGITSQPYRPRIPGEESFNRPLFHSSDMPKYHASIMRQPTNTIAVYGGTKSAWDAVYTAASAGATVHWIIRDNGHGPVWMSPIYVTPFRRWIEKLVTTRFLTWLSPCIWSDPAADGGARIRAFLHGTWFGRQITDAFWRILGNDVAGLNKYDAHPETAKLRPWIPAFWVATGLSILNYPTNFFDLVQSGQVRVHIDHITSLSEGAIHLSNPDSPVLRDIDALVVASGWKPTPNITFNPPSLLSSLGFPTAPDPLPSSLITAADTEILRRFPRLAQQPVLKSPVPYQPIAGDSQTESQAIHPYRLTRFIAPVGDLGRDRSIAVMGVAMTFNTPLLAQTQALWVAAYLSNQLSLNSIPREKCPADVRALLDKEGQSPPSDSTSDLTTDSPSSENEADVLWETALHTQFGVHRYPGGLGKRNPDFVFDALPYVDILLRDLGVNTSRKKGWRRWVEPHGMEDYGGVVEEWVARNQGNGVA